jgi:hypothetical protein
MVMDVNEHALCASEAQQTAFELSVRVSEAPSAKSYAYIVTDFWNMTKTC